MFDISLPLPVDSSWEINNIIYDISFFIHFFKIK